jgi:imidazolonepropionase-like amidohydrolase
MTHTRMRFPSYRAGHRIWTLACLAFLIAISAQLVKTEEPLVFAITNARIIPVAGAPIERGTIVIRRGVIEAIGANVTAPGDARLIDASGLTAYPGLIDAFSDIGLEESTAGRGAAPAAATPAPVRGAQQPQPQPSTIPPDERQGLTPYRRAFEEINPAHRKIESARAVGITTTSIVPRRGFFPGQGSLLNLSGPEVGAMVVKPATSFYINTAGRGGGGGGGGGNYPGSLMGILAFVKQTLLDADRYATAWNIYRANPGAERPEYSRALEALQPVLKREMPVIMPANSPAEIQRALDLADAFKLNLMLMGCAEGGKMAPALKSRNIPVLLAVKYPDRPSGTDPDFREELDSLRRRVEAPANAAALARAGVRFALVSDDMANPRDFINNIGRAIEAGLDKEVALRALTLTPAEILGVADRLGAIEKNKTANLILATGDIFDQKTRVKFAFIDGRKFDIPEQQPAPSGTAGRGGPGR